MGALTDKYCIVGVGETPHMRPSNRTTLSMACEAITKAMDIGWFETAGAGVIHSYIVAGADRRRGALRRRGLRLE